MVRDNYIGIQEFFFLRLKKIMGKLDIFLSLQKPCCIPQTMQSPSIYVVIGRKVYINQPIEI